MARWFRSHAGKLNKPKVLRLSDKLYRAWDSLLCVACEFEGVLPSLADTALLLRKGEPQTQALIDELIEREFFIKTERGVEPHKWNEWQYKSDRSTERVQQFRERQRNVSGNVSETPSESESETEAETERTAAKAAVRRRSPADERRNTLPPDWRPTPDDRDHASDKGLDPDTTATAFADYFGEGRGRTEKRTGAGWSKRFRIWCNRDAERGPARVPGVRSAGTGGDAGAFARAATRMGGS